MIGLTPTLGFVTGDDLWVIATAVLCSVSCGVLGCFLVLRRMSLLGDAISHSILPGLAGAFLLTGSREPWAMLAGAMVVGVATSVFAAGLHRYGRVPEDAAMGVVFTTLFAVGVLLITLAAPSVDLDPGCVLYGNIEYVPLDTMPVGGVPVPRATLWLAAMLLVNVGVVAACYKELKIVSFDTTLAASMGISVGVVHYGLMTLVAATSVASFESVGSVLVVAMLVAPGAAAHLLTDRLGRMLWIAAGLGATAAVIGYLLAVWANTSVAGMVSVVAAGQFVIAAAMGPRHGVVSKVLRTHRLRLRIAQEDVLGSVFRAVEAGGDTETTVAIQSLAAGGASRTVERAIRSLVSRGLLRRVTHANVVLTDEGTRAAADLVRGHRLWESFLAGTVGLPADHVHEPSHRVEHFLDETLLARLGAQTGATRDPHGTPIPPAGNSPTQPRQN